MREQQALHLKVDPTLPIPINVQLKEQFKWLIGLNIIKNGEILPSANHLAEQLQVNRNTVNLVYTQLRDEGLVSIQKGRGTQVADNPVVEEIRKKRKPLFSFIERIMKEAIAEAYHVDELLLSGFAYIQLFGDKHNKLPNVLLIECKEHDYNFYQAEIKRITGAHVKTVFYEDIASSPALLDEYLHNADAVVTTLNHSEEVRGLLASRNKAFITVGATADISLLLDIAKLQPGSKVGFVCLGNKGGQWMAQRVKEAGINQFTSTAQGIDDKQKLLKMLDEVDRVYASPSAYNEVENLVPEKASLYPLRLEKSSEDLLRNFISNEK